MRAKLIIDGNAVYEIDEGCMRRKQTDHGKNCFSEKNGKEHAGLEKLKNLKRLNVRNNEIASLSGVESLTQLVELNASRNKLTGIREAASLGNLKKLNVNDNQIKSLNGVEHLQKLEWLQASSNCLGSLTDMSQLKKLDYLDVNDNCLSSVNEICALQKLDVLGISYNKLTELPDLSSYSNISLIRFNFNNLKETKEELKRKLPQNYFNNYGDLFENDFSFQNLDYAIDFTEPAGAELINANTTRIAGHIHMPAKTIQITLTDNINDDDGFTDYFYADVDENGNFVFEYLDLRKYVKGKWDMRIGICLEYDKENHYYSDTGLRRYRIK